MPPTLDLSRTSHSKMAMSTPRINLRRAASYNHDKGPLSSTSSRFTFNHLVFSPPPSPGLPSLSPPLRKPQKGLAGLMRPSRIIRYTFWAFGAFCIYTVVRWVLYHGGPVSIPVLPAWATGPSDQYEMVAQDDLPDFPTPVAVTDGRGRPRWTVSIPPNHDFPLSISQYTDMCAKCHEVSERVHDLRSQSHGLQQAYLGFRLDSTDANFIDVREAEKAGYLGHGRQHQASGSGLKPSGLVGESNEGIPIEKPVCERSMTFVLESADAGLGKTLLMLWTAYGLAKHEGRAFFIDDTRWAYGSYTEIFQAPPSQKCEPPPRHEMLPCPRQARHLVVSAATAAEIFDTRPAASSTSSTTTALNNNPDTTMTEGGDPLLSSLNLTPAARKATFALTRAGYNALFRLIKEDGDYVDTRVRELMARRMVPNTKGKHNGLIVGVHVRRGDRHPLEYQYRDSYVPLNKYAEVARDAIDRRLTASGDDAAAKQQSFVVLASDDPVVHDAAEFAGWSRPAQLRIKLASKQTSNAQEEAPDRHVMRKFVDETFGWEGGFFAAMFWNLGTRSANGANLAGTIKGFEGAAVRRATSPETIRLRSLMGRAYVMDLAVLADASDVVVCTVSAVGCRLLAVMMGWESAGYNSDANMSANTNAVEDGGWEEAVQD
ncbi:hypothetical protein B0T17DRAFT_616885 [Bombardia bombarda]|uniref:Uncharacterized protein n=1 Tax=Bombardia bombarda TaxID=252184 RepID=A0AA40C4F9_9PEZI|nr:hypothetical protein B0T17DRAFT_616885 [Bombardia bombarda]